MLAEASEPLNTKQMVEAMAAKKLWTSPGGKTPDQTLYASILRDLRKDVLEANAADRVKDAIVRAKKRKVTP